MLYVYHILLIMLICHLDGMFQVDFGMANRLWWYPKDRYFGTCCAADEPSRLLTGNL